LTKIIQTTFFIPQKNELIDMLLEAKEREFFAQDNGSIIISKDMVQKIMKPIFESIQTKYKVKKAWIYHMDSKATLEGHYHKYAVGVYYLKVDKNVGALFFENLDVKIKPEVGMFVVIPANETHSVLKNKSNELRISLCMELIKN